MTFFFFIVWYISFNYLFSFLIVIVRTMNAIARTASSVDRLHDALVSLRFMIEVDVLSQSINQVRSNYSSTS